MEFDAKGTWQKRCWRCWRDDRDKEEWTKAYSIGFGKGREAGGGGLDDETLRTAIALCHPDRHPPERAAEANEVTAALLRLREARRG
jgi:hypothetical protein